jgi:hypothetical protein
MGTAGRNSGKSVPYYIYYEKALGYCSEFLFTKGLEFGV